LRFFDHFLILSLVLCRCFYPGNRNDDDARKKKKKKKKKVLSLSLSLSSAQTPFKNELGVCVRSSQRKFLKRETRERREREREKKILSL
jgi:hypothetical protein